MRHSGEVTPFESQVSTGAYTERISNDKSVCRKVYQRLRGFCLLSGKPWTQPHCSGSRGRAAGPPRLLRVTDASQTARHGACQATH